MSRGRFDEAIALQREAVVQCEKFAHPLDVQALTARLDLAEMLLLCGQVDAAGDVLASERTRLAADPLQSGALRARQLHGWLRHLRGEVAAAIAELEGVLAEQRRQADADSPLVAATAELLAEALLDGGRPQRAADLAATAAHIRAAKPYPRWRLSYAEALGALARRDADPRAAAADFAAAWASLRAELALPPIRRLRLEAAAMPLAPQRAPAGAASR
jgi:hypothetical protein